MDRQDRMPDRGLFCFLIGFVVPAMLVLLGYIVIKVWPFGDGTVLIIDSLHQYLPFYTEFHEKLRSGSSLFYSFSAGLGFDFWATYAYYLASPFNLLIGLVPRANVCDFMDYLILFKIGMCGGIFSWYLYQREKSRGNRRDDYGLYLCFFPIVFGTMFAMGNYMIGYYFNLMWLDSIAVLPLIMYGIEKISAGKKGWIYGLSLFYGIWCNYYIGFMLCIFCCLYFISQLMIRRGMSLRSCLKRCLHFGWYSLLAGGMASVVLVPAYTALKASESMQGNSFPSRIKFYVDFISLMLSHGTEQHPINISDSQVGLNAYCGTAVLILVVLYVLDRKISWREKLGKLLISGFLLLSFSVNILNYIWHGFHTQNGLPNRFAFLYILMLLVMAYDVLGHFENWKIPDVLIAGAAPSALFIISLVCRRGDVEEYGKWLWLTPVFLIAWTMVFLLLKVIRPKPVVCSALIGGLLLAEAGAHGIYGYIYDENVTRSIYLDDQKSWEKLVGEREKDNPEFFRSEIDSQRMRNVTMFAGGNSMVIFNSMMQVSVTDFCDRLGIEARTNKNGYNGVTRLMNDVFGIRYVLASIGKGDTLYHFEKIDSDDNLTLYQNDNALSIGFMVNPEIRYWDTEEGNPIDIQDEFVDLATGIPGIYTLDRVIDAEDGVRYEVKIPDNKQVYLYLDSRVSQMALDTPEYDRTYKTYTDHLYSMDSLGDENIGSFTLTLKNDDDIQTVEVYTCPDAELQEVIDILARDQLKEVRAEGNRLTGRITASKDGIMLLTIPFSENWTVKVDGEKAEPLEIGGMLTGVELLRGEHQIAMEYIPGGFYPGLALSLLCLLLLILTILAERKLIPGKSTASDIPGGKGTKGSFGRIPEANGKNGIGEGVMKLHFSRKSEAFGAGIFQVLDDKKKELEKQGKKIWNLSVGTPDFKPSQEIMNAVSQAALKPENYRYSLRELPELIRAVQDFYKKRFHVELEENEIMSVYGSQEGMAHIAWAVCDPGDVVLVPNPGYPIFKIGPELCGAKTWEYPLLPENDYLPDLAAIPEEIRMRAKLMIVNYPGNPLCKAAPDSFYENLIRFAAANDILILHDNAYADIIFGGREGKSLLNFPGGKEVGIEFYSLSKTFDYTGARVSFVVGNAQVIGRFRAVRSQFDYGLFYPAQYGAVAALSQPLEIAKEQSVKYEERSKALCEGLRSIGWEVPDSEGTMFVWAPLPKGYHNSNSFCMELMEKSGVICTPGSSFGSLGEGYVRFALVLPPEELKEAVQSIKDSGIINQAV